MQYLVTATSLRVRKGPALNEPILATLSNGQLVNVVNNNNPEWWQVSFTSGDTNFNGYVASRYLQLPPQPPAQVNPHNVPAVHYPTGPASNRNSVNSRHTPLSEADLPKRKIAGKTKESNIADVYKIIAFLDVETHARYQRSPKSTYCNIYAYDFCFASQVYLPRVWWTSKTLIEFAKTNGYSPAPSYGKNVSELNANSLFEWLNEWSDDFGWVRTYDLTELQTKVNEGGVGLICAKRRDLSRSGHITCVIPETPGHAALRSGNKVTAPLQSQAGAKNKKYFVDTWWIRLATEFSEFGYWYHD
jgi:hypothetical protein